MNVTVKHVFQSSKADSADATLIQPSHWNSDHSVDVLNAVESVFGRIGVVVATTGDYDISQISNAVTTVFGRKGSVVAQVGDYNINQVTNGVSTAGSYADPPWITSLAWNKISGAPATGVSSVFGRAGAVVATAGDYTAAQVTNAVSTLGSYANPSWITSLDWGKISGPPTFVVDPTTTKGDLLVRNISSIARLPVGSDGLVLISDSSVATGVKWASAASAGSQSPWVSNIDGGGFTLSNAVLSNGIKSSVQTPWLQSIDGAAFNLSNINNLNVNLLATVSTLHVTNNGIGSISSILAHGGNDYTFKLITRNGPNVSGAGAEQMRFGLDYSDLWNTGIVFYRGVSGNDGFLGLDAGSSEKMRILANGNVGIGTQNPHTPLEVFQTGDNLVKAIFGHATAAVGININYGLPTIQGYNGVATTGSAPLLLNPTGGNIGINVANPVASFHLGPNTGFILSGGYISETALQPGSFSIQIDDGNSRLYIRCKLFNGTDKSAFIALT